MKNLLTVFMAVMVSFTFQAAFSKPVTRTSASVVARNFLSRWETAGNLKSGVKTSLVCKEYGNLQNSTGTPSESPAFYVFDADPSGFVIVSGDDGVPPVLAYSGENHFDFDNIPTGVEILMNRYKEAINYAIRNNLPSTDDVRKEWTTYLNSDADFKAISAIDSVKSLTTTKWGYGYPYNYFCPKDTALKSVELNKHRRAGCAAVAMAQLMKYWNWPKKGWGGNSYPCLECNDSLWADFGRTYYDWNHMPDRVESDMVQIRAVAGLIYHCGVSVDMQYDHSVSSATFLYDPIGLPGKNTVETAFPKYFRYKNSIKGFDINNSNPSWVEIIKKEIVSGRPVLYAGEDLKHEKLGDVGHALIFDGFDKSGRLSVNWGANGAYNGYFYMDVLKFPISTTDSLNFIEKSSILIGIEPGSFGTYPDSVVVSQDLAFRESLKIYPNPASDRLYVDLTGAMGDYKNIDILNSLGMKILSFHYSGRQVPIPLDKCTSGIYFIRLNNREKYITKKFIVKK
jgi:hypothetical protein